MPANLVGFHQLNRFSTALAGGKAANLGELCKIKDLEVPPGFCITTKAYQDCVGRSAAVQALVGELRQADPDNRSEVAAIAKALRSAIEEVSLSQEVEEELAAFVQRYPARAYAVRSSATAEDLPSASFAGQQESYLNISGLEKLKQYICKCWASLFTDRAISYRAQNGIDHAQVMLAVVIQEMVLPEAAGIMFTADPMTGNRKITSIDAGFGLGEALVSGVVSADNFRVTGDEIIEHHISDKKLAIFAKDTGGIQLQKLGVQQSLSAALTDPQVLELAALGQRIQAHFGSPQDIEWCLSKGTFYIVQSRPITTLFPIPETDDTENHVYVSVGHQQMMTDAMKPLGLSFFMLMSGGHMRQAGNRLFVDVSRQLASPAARDVLINALGQSDPLLRDALQHLVSRNYIALVPDEADKIPRVLSSAGTRKMFNDEDTTLIKQVVKEREAEIATLNREIAEKSGAAVFESIRQDMARLKTFLFDAGKLGIIMSAIDAAVWLNKHIQEWLGEKNVADTLSLSVSGNITSEMGLELMEVADVIRPWPEVVAYLQQTNDPHFLDQLGGYPGGAAAVAAIRAFLEKFGMRCSGEIDITRTRWSENPLTLVPLLLSNIRNFEAGAGKQKFEQNRQLALNKEKEILSRLEQLPEGAEKAAETRQMISLVRNFSGYREYPKYWWVNHFFAYKQALLKEAHNLAAMGLVNAADDVFFLRFDEFETAVQTGAVDQQLIETRKASYTLHQKLSPPRVMTSDGEIITGAYKREDLPENALPGLAVSAGTVEGRARVIFSMEEAAIEVGDILVTPYTDPSWTPLFVAVKGLVTEVGGLMTHGAVVAREYGLPAVVGVQQATKLIRDGQRIRLNGTDGYIELL
ncbi:phosphoenolpyruvate synthase [Pedobacter yulinensis]|uniref:Prodigiosin synthesizing transferase PigC n=1 Tax=Pedobacter yulinensis TaxID=2126353 RepID=A0A2T3HJ06_9SPHI|nr:phosphoenolpyruvate synthase [Pedobacter yulinensis]